MVIVFGAFFVENISKASEMKLDDSKILFTGDGVAVTQKDLSIQTQLMAKNLRVSREEKLKVILMNRLFTLEVKNNSVRLGGYDLNKAMQLITEQYVGRLYRKKLRDSIDVPDEVLESYYLSNPDQFIAPVEYNVRMLSVPNKLMCEKLRDDIKKGVKTFPEVANKLSVEETNNFKGGLLGWMKQSRMPREFNENIKNLKKGDMSQPFKFHNNWVILQLDDIRPSEKIEFSKAKANIKAELDQKLFVKEMNSAFDALKKKYNVK